MDHSASKAAVLGDSNNSRASEHFVQFYEDDAYLLGCVSNFIETGLRAGEGTIVIATKVHREAVEERLAKGGLDLAALRGCGQYLALDATETLSRFMVDGSPHEALFNEVVGSLIARLCQGGRPLRAFGEMVSLLWGEGNGTAAIDLEELWNNLGKTHAFSLFCAYPIGGFRGEAKARPLIHICKQHSRVVPAESYSEKNDGVERLRSIALLQQKASSLEAEVTDRKQAEWALRQQETKLTMAAAVAQLGVWELDLITNVVTCSEQCQAHLGLAPREVLTCDRFVELVHPDDRGTVEKMLRDAIAVRGEYNAEYRVIKSSGEVRWLAVMGRCFHNGSQQMVGVTQDITDRRRSAEILEHAVAERTAALRETVAELEAFSYSVSHDMREPLRSMRGFADVLMQQCGDQLTLECREYLKRINSAGERMDRLIQDVLTFSRVARIELKLEPVNLDHLVRGILECCPNLQPPLAEIVIEGNLPNVLGNAAALTQCLSNLLGNAVKFVAPGAQPRVRVWAETVRVNAGRGNRSPTVLASRVPVVRLYVQDNGIGIPKEAQEKIFTIFHRLHKTYEGTGIGLAIVKKAAERIGAKVGVTSKLGQGSTFWLELKHVHGATT